MYIGEFKNDERDGHGTYLYENDDAEYGEWKHDSESGLRHYIEKVDGIVKIQKGEWIENEVKYYADKVTEGQRKLFMTYY